MIPILIVIPFWSGDDSQAIELCKIISGMQPGHVGNVANVMLVCRQDWHIDPNMVKIVSSKFNTFTFHSMSPLRGWPAGANGMFGTTMIHIATGFPNRYECIYWMEPDAIPLCPNWFWDLVLEWRRRHSTTNIVGCRADCNGDGSGDHITGCAIYDPNIARILPQITTCDNVAWDYQYKDRIVQMGGPTRLIENWYKATNANPGILDRTRVGCVIVHGFKDFSVVDLVKKKYGIT